jgi:leucyl/phenylalanyl-tRNA--protein transferase
MTLAVLPPYPVRFPRPETALRNPNGLLAAGGRLTTEWLLAAYASGIFPWFDDDRDPVLWWSPDPRAVLVPQSMHVTRRLERRFRTSGFSVTFDRGFDAVTAGCAAPRASRGDTRPGTWITPAMRAAYLELHRAGYAHSVEVWRGTHLVGGLYGVSLGTLFFAESMFSRESDASKIALLSLARQVERWGFHLIDCQVMNPHLERLGVSTMPRQRFLEYVRRNDRTRTRKGAWTLDSDLAGPAHLRDAAGRPDR